MIKFIIKYINVIHTLRLALASLMLLNMIDTNAQQVPHYAQYKYNMQVLNPAFVGSKSDFNATLLSRQQWINVEGAPETTTFSVNTRLNSGFGLGATVISDQIGLVDNTDINLDISYTVPTSEYGRLALGVKSGMAFFNNDLASGITVDNEVYASTSGDYGNLGFGMLYSSRDYYVGLSVQNLFKSPVFELQDDIQTVEGLERGNYFLTGGMSVELSKFNDIVFYPSAMVKYTPTLPVSIDMSANFVFDKKFEAGVSYRLQNSMSAMVAAVINDKYRIGYAYENYITGLGQNLNTHEIILRIDLDLNRDKRWLYMDCCYF
jgi:type IX secretion system PorP/SprF family membrane protein